MARVVLILLAAVIFMGCQTNTATPTHEQSLSPEQVNEKIADLEKFIIPPKGTNKADVDAVFGESQTTPERKFMPTSTYPMRFYQLLPPKQKDFQIFLYVAYREDKVHYIGVNHPYIENGRPPWIHSNEIAKDNRIILADLLEIKNKYDSKLKTASWNRQVCK